MKSLFFKLVIVLIALAGWIAYDQRQAIMNFSLSDIKKLVPESLPKNIGDKKGSTTTVYKWQDSSGKWHFGDTRPKDVKAVSVKKIRSDVNVMPSHPVEKPGMPQNKVRIDSQPGSRSQSTGSGKTSSGTGASSGAKNGSKFPLSPNRYKRAIEQAKEARKAMEQRNQELDSMAR
ncbi:MAG: hypothetical protein BMS9Abin33_0282 [Gammaproteobacteria bacterium]|nr:MAG: hypothetical protein BMS9Abin33_0282 [Gammaproteobacteria bacterium]